MSSQGPRWLAPILSAMLASTAAAGCTTASALTVCGGGTELRRRIYSGGGEAEWCRRPDGVRQGPETRYYENGAQQLSGAYEDGAQHGVWRHRFNNGRNWRADRWEDGAVVQRTIDPAVASMSAVELEALGPMTSGIIKLASRDPMTGDNARGGSAFVKHHANGRPRLAGQYDADGLRTGVWRYWYEDGRPAREIEYLAGVRERTARQWHRSGAPAVEGSYAAGEPDGRWRWWDEAGRLVKEATFAAVSSGR